MDIQKYIEQLTATKQAADADAATQAETIAGLKASLSAAQGAQQVDAIVSQGLQDIIDKLNALLPPALAKPA